MAKENSAVVAVWLRGVNEQGEPPRELCDEHIDIENVADSPLQGPYRGYDGAQRWVSDIFDVLDGPRIEMGESIEASDGETVVTKLRLLGRARHSQLDIEYPWTAVWIVRDGVILHAHGYATWIEALEAVGLQE